jgi:hypothetical protein
MVCGGMYQVHIETLHDSRGGEGTLREYIGGTWREDIGDHVPNI